MSLGKKVFSLLVVLFGLIIYTLVSFDYDNYMKDNKKENNFEFNVDYFITLTQNLQTKAYEVKDELIKSIGLEEQKTNSQIEQPQKVEVLEQKQKEEVVEEPKKQAVAVQEKLESNETTEKLVVEEQAQNEIEEIEDLNSTSQESVQEIEVVEEPQEVVFTKEMVQELINDVLKQNKIVFKRRSVDITKDSFSSVEKVAQILKEHESFIIEIAGHTDSRGRASLNKRISQQRADSVKKALVGLGVDTIRLKAVGYGEQFPIAKDDKDGLSEINRRVEINIVGDKK